MNKLLKIKNIFNEVVAVELSISKYNSGQLAVQLIEKETECPYLIATVNVPDIKVLLENQIIIKNYSENKGIIDFFIDNGLIKEDYNSFYVGHGGECCICKMTKKFMDLVENEME